MKRNVLLFISLCVVGCVMTYAQQMPGRKRLRDSILSPIFHSYIFAIYKNESLWI